MAGRIILGIANPALNANGVVDSGSTLTFYMNGNTTPQTIYADPTLVATLSNPLSCDSAGRFPEIWGPDSSSYSIKWTPTGASPITYDNITAIPATVAGQVLGTATNDNAAAGYVGEYVSATGSVSTPTDNQSYNVTSISLASGDWDVSALGVVTNTGSLQYSQASISTTSATFDRTIGHNINSNDPNTGAQGVYYPFPPIRFSLATTTTIYLVMAQALGTTVVFNGIIHARRAR